MLTSKEKVLNDIIIQAKLGNKEKFEDIRKMYFPLQNQITNSFYKKYPFLEYTSFAVFQNIYIGFWDAINTFSFSGKHSFGLYVKKTLIDKINDVIYSTYGVKASYKEINNIIYENAPDRKPHKKRRCIIFLLGLLTPTERRSVFYRYYQRLKEEKYKEYTNLSRYTENPLISKIIKKIRKKTSRLLKDITFDENGRIKYYKMIETSDFRNEKKTKRKFDYMLKKRQKEKKNV